MYGRPKVTRIRAISQAIRLKWNGRRVHRWSGQVLETVDYAGFTAATLAAAMFLLRWATQARD
jgi:hypothetical protein